MNKPMFSIIVPVYNAEKTVSRTIHHLKAILFDSYEVLLINDGSTDQTYELISREITGDSRFQVYTTKNQGPGSARNFGISRAAGKYLLFFDADDYPSPSVLIDYSKLLESNNRIQLIISSFTMITRYNEKLSKKKYLVEDIIYYKKEDFQNSIYQLMCKQLMYVLWNKCYRRDLIIENNIRFKNYRSCEDRMFNLEYFKLCDVVAMNSKNEYYYEYDPSDGITTRYFDDKFDSFKEFYQLANQVTLDRNRTGMAALHLKGTVSVIFSIFGNAHLPWKKKKSQVYSILNDDTIIEAKKITEVDTTPRKLTKLIFDLPNALSFCILNFGSWVERKFPKIIFSIKKRY
ncbi:glycosyl transferase family 2 [Enterococcus florum]|uniref:Glycosyl transferase family 2 n=1 Tax=Enterococcus florum TaxID=2480627 RepID=A0A4P5P8Q2_9ENTE|nr:glycosyltransferase family A protein [Enterococcus florum]GCF93916.1 glycosyl transferase family 2 [Enterococcus florum]